MNEAAPDQPERHAETLELINTEVTASLARQFNSAKSIDTKAITVVGYAGAAATFLATRHAEAILAALAYAAYALAAVFGMWAFALRTYTDVPQPRDLFNGYWTDPKAQVLAALAATRVKAFESNVKEERRKRRRWWLSVASLAVGITLMILSLTSAYWST
jgi:hypothetical protein